MAGLIMEIRDRVLTAARNWIDTPYMHAASMRGVGCDCLGLVRGIWRDIYGDEPEMPPPYAPDWIETCGRETLKEAAARHMNAIGPDAALPGDLVLFRIGYGSVAKHAAILTDENKIIHAYSRHAVIESPMGTWWKRRLTYAFSFPGIN